MTFGEKIQQARKEAGISQEELSFQLHVSRQAISKWENDNGYPEIEKIIKMSEMFHVTLDYLLHDAEEPKETISTNEKGFYVSQEMASGYLLHQTLKYRKMAWAIALLLAGAAFVFLFNEIGALLYLMAMIISAALFISILLTGNPYPQLQREPLLFDEGVKEELVNIYMAKKKKYNVLILVSIILFGISFLVLPLIGIELVEDWVSMMLAMSMILSGTSVYLFIYFLGILQSYRFLAYKTVENNERKELK
ncbi:helix-turn-helix transcriptional regulator [Virgibacillus sp. NKC19-3]|uniref:helix-turn-helix domain-containing protein n=1 Tax=Virgibacillus saliphilus TaxID=2831674 RepID=UPI001C9B0A81|nr:helix-turn-helix transcriptional regulator [Virgibacillus sp. NKC19-3]MBY7144952.1 helix-turn-helix transcriptional regulator [Virgibacillus sp. NKC19-3]